MEFWYEILSDSILGEALDVFQDQHGSNKQLDVSLKKNMIKAVFESFM